MEAGAATPSSLQYGSTEDTITQEAASRLLWFPHEILHCLK